MQNPDSQSNGLSYVPYTSKRHSRSMSATSDDFRASGSISPAERAVPPAKAPERNDHSPSTGTTFRRLGPRPSQPPAPSPLRPKPGEPMSPPATRTFRPLEPRSSSSLPPSLAPSTNEALLPPRLPPKHVLSEPPPSGLSPSPSPAVSPAIPIHPLPDPPLAQSESRATPPPVLESRAMPPLPPSPQPPVPSPSPSLSADLANRQRAAPYRPGFQPKGVYRHRTDEFVAARNLLTNHRKGEERRIERRLEKLVDLHFPLESNSRPETSRRSSSLFNLSELRVRNPAELLRSVMDPKPGTVAAIRATEQIITPWQEDSSVSSCPICQSSFHPLSNRKHHCRLCGRVICALPPRKPNRPRPCSLLITADRQTGRVRPIPETIDYGVSKRSSSSLDSTSSKSLADPGVENQPKGIRVCCECNAIIDRKQFIHEAHSSSTFTKLYEAFTRIEGEIESALGTLEALLPSMVLSPTNPEAVDLKRQLSVLFTDYDTIAKRIRALPVPTPDGSQERVQQAVWTRAVHFMQSHVGILQRIPKPPVPPKNSKSSRNHGVDGYESAGDPEKVDVEADSALAHSLQPLLEQEALLETFIVEANAQRKFEDVKSLKANLAEIRGEIGRLVAASNVRTR